MSTLIIRQWYGWSNKKNCYTYVILQVFSSFIFTCFSIRTVMLDLQRRRFCWVFLFSSLNVLTGKISYNICFNLYNIITNRFFCMCKFVNILWKAHAYAFSLSLSLSWFAGIPFIYIYIIYIYIIYIYIYIIYIYIIYIYIFGNSLSLASRYNSRSCK